MTNWKVVALYSPSTTANLIKWSPPMDNCFKLNFDGSAIGNPALVSIIRDSACNAPDPNNVGPKTLLTTKLLIIGQIHACIPILIDTGNGKLYTHHLR